MGAQSCQKPKVYDGPKGAEASSNAELSAKFNLILCTSRFAHYLKVMARDAIGTFKEVKDVDHWLNEWINNYTCDPLLLGRTKRSAQAAGLRRRSRYGP